MEAGENLIAGNELRLTKADFEKANDLMKIYINSRTLGANYEKY